MGHCQKTIGNAPFLMATKKPIGTISYNSGPFLVSTFNELMSDGLIDDWRAIYHYKEREDKKDHWHINLFPCKSLDLVLLGNRFLEPDPSCPDKPLCCLPWRNSEPLNWLLYVLHDPEYLLYHPDKSGGDGKIVYDLQDIYCGCKEYLEEDYIRAGSIRQSANHKALSYVQNGYSFTEVLSLVPSLNPVALNAIFKGVFSELPKDGNPFSRLKDSEKGRDEGLQ